MYAHIKHRYESLYPFSNKLTKPGRSPSDAWLYQPDCTRSTHPQPQPHVASCGVVASCGLLWPPVASCGLLWPPVASCGLLWPPVASCGILWPTVASCSLLWPPLALCGLLWSPVASCGLLLCCDILWLLWAPVASCGLLWTP
jgi:hypothetical protein